MDIKDYTGKVIRVSYVSYGKESVKTGIVVSQETYNDRVRFSMLLTNGGSWNPTFSAGETFKISSVRIDENLRSALVDYYKVKVKHNAFLKQYEEKKREFDGLVGSALGRVKEASDELTVSECMNAIEDLFKEKYPSTGGRWSDYFACRSGGPESVSVSHCQEITKWAKPEEYSFIHRRYDDTLTIDNDSQECKTFCRINAPGVKSELSQFKSDVYATIGDKGFLSVERVYEIPLKYGTSKKSIEHIKEAVFGIKPSLDGVINAASRQGSQEPSKGKIKDFRER